MPVDLRLQPLDALIRDHPGWRGVLEEFGIDGRGGAGVTLAAAADRANVDVETVLAAMSGPRPDRWRCDTIDDAPLRSLIRHVEDVHHALLRAQIAEIAGVIRDQRRARPGDRLLEALDDSFVAFSSEMETHLHAEEEELFPMCRALVDAFSWPSFHSGPVADPIRLLRHDHDHVARLLADVLAVSEPGTPARRLLEALAADLDRHLVEENDLLFPEVLRLADELSIT